MKKKQLNKTSDKNKYLEIYIEENGRLILTPLKNETLSLAKAISGKSNPGDTVFCG